MKTVECAGKFAKGLDALKVVSPDAAVRLFEKATPKATPTPKSHTQQHTTADNK